MTRSHRSPSPVPLQPTHRRNWRTFWRRCTCGLTAPCVDRIVPPKERPFPPRGTAVAIGRASCRTNSPQRAQAGSTSRPDTGSWFGPNRPHQSAGALETARATTHSPSPTRPESRRRSGASSRPQTGSRADSSGALAESRLAQPIRAPYPMSAGSHDPMKLRDNRVESRSAAGVPQTRCRSNAPAPTTQVGRAGHLTPAQAHRAGLLVLTHGNRRARDAMPRPAAARTGH